MSAAEGRAAAAALQVARAVATAVAVRVVVGKATVPRAEVEREAAAAGVAEAAAVPGAEGGGEGGGLYVTGWLRRGATGVILENVGDAIEAAGSVLADRAAMVLPPPHRAREEAEALLETLRRERGVVDFDGWLRIDAEEKRRGEVYIHTYICIYIYIYIW